MEKKAGSKAAKFEKPKANIIKRNIENAKKTRNKSKENPQHKALPAKRVKSAKPKTKKLTEATNTATDTFESIKSPVPPNKISPVKAKNNIAVLEDPIIKPLEVGEEVSIAAEEKIEKVIEETLLVVESSPIKQGVIVVKASSVKRKRLSDESMEKSVKKSL